MEAASNKTAKRKALFVIKHFCAEKKYLATLSEQRVPLNCIATLDEIMQERSVNERKNERKEKWN